ncbi:hypothetical protein [Allosalinactinospora lopnorensis]|uniref:hypothetical protein n=1 Tax=Allosalinactinospora lopnorensis TaxID=1352348 RepID=UPI0012E1CDE1|nr:hypothetical protein [Allosalinactinospora lopnorensis]
MVYKPLSGVWHADEGQVRLIHTTPIDDPDDLLDPKPGLTAHLFQERIPVAYAVRAVVVGERVFAARIDADSPTAQQDWRADYESLRHWPDGAPYDRVHVTCAIRRIPDALVTTRPGGIIVAPWQPGYGFGGIVGTTVSEGVAHGRFHGRAGYMMLGSPGPDRFGLTVTAESGHLLWLDEPGRVLSGR